MDKRKGKWSEERKAKWLASRHPLRTQETNNSVPNSNNPVMDVNSEITE